jgi:hypothetical protein
MMIFTAIGIVVKLFLAQSGSQDGSTGPANATIWGYGIIAVSLFCTIFIKYALSSKSDLVTRIGSSTNPIAFVTGLLKQLMPITFVFAVLVWTIILNSTFLVKINKGEVTPTYSNLSWTSTLLILFQLILVFKIVKDELTPNASGAMKSFNSQISALSYLIGTVNFVMLGIMNMSLVFFSTDG